MWLTTYWVGVQSHVTHGVLIDGFEGVYLSDTFMN